jgi:hypothetical protein
MMLISPFNTLISCGSSLIFALRKIFPNGRMRGSFLIVTVPVPILGLSFSMVANLITSNFYRFQVWPEIGRSQFMKIGQPKSALFSFLFSWPNSNSLTIYDPKVTLRAFFRDFHNDHPNKIFSLG